MSQSRLRYLVSFSAYLLIFLSLSITQLQGLHLSVCPPTTGTTTFNCSDLPVDATKLSSSQWIDLKESEQGDLISYLLMGKAWLGQIPMDEGMRWRFKNWPPVTALVSALALLGEPQISYGMGRLIIICLIAAAVWSAMFGLLATKKSHTLVSFFMLLVPLIGPDLRNQLFGKGILLSESLAILFTMAGFIFFVSYLQRAKTIDLIVCALLWALSINTRAQLEYIIWAGLLASVGLGLVAALYQKTINLKTDFELLQKLKSIFILFILINLFIVPWKLRNQRLEGNFAIIGTTQAIFNNLWTPTEKLPYWSDNSNTACQLDPELCKSISETPAVNSNTIKMLTFAVLFEKPKDWLKLRLRQTYSFLVPEPFYQRVTTTQYLSWGWQSSLARHWAKFEFGLGLFAWIAYLFLIVKSFKAKTLRMNEMMIVFFGLGILLIHFTFFLFIPPEPRYFLFVRLFAYLFLLHQAFARTTESTEQKA